MKADKELMAFREGVKWGFDLFSHQEGNTMVITHSDGENLSQLKFYREVDSGRWDDATRNRLHSPATIIQDHSYTPWRKTLAWIGLATLLVFFCLALAWVVEGNMYVDRVLSEHLK